jgi:hypothetical protein
MRRILFLALMIVLISSTIYARNYNITFGWNANAEPDLAGYRLYQSEVSGEYTDSLKDFSSDVIMGSVEIDINSTQYFVLTAYDDSGNESDYSNEVTFIPDLSSPAAPINFKIENVTIIIN